MKRHGEHVTLNPTLNRLLLTDPPTRFCLCLRPQYAGGTHSKPGSGKKTETFHCRPTEILIVILILIVISCQRADYDYDHDYDYDRIFGNHSLAETQKTSINAGYSQGVRLPVGRQWKRLRFFRPGSQRPVQDHRVSQII